MSAGNYSTILTENNNSNIRVLANQISFQNWGPNKIAPTVGLATNLSATSNFTVMTIVNSNVGIRTSAPIAALDVAGNINLTGSITRAGGVVAATNWQATGTTTWLATGSNLGIGTNNTQGNAIYTMGTISACNVFARNAFFIANDSQAVRNALQLSPLKANYVIQTSKQSVFTFMQNGIYTGNASNCDVFLDGLKLVYKSPTEKDYDLSYQWIGLSNTQYTITLTQPASYGDILDVAIWPSFYETTSCNLPGYVYQTFGSYQWQNQGSGNTYTLGSVGIGSTIPQYTLDVASSASRLLNHRTYHSFVKSFSCAKGVAFNICTITSSTPRSPMIIKLDLSTQLDTTFGAFTQSYLLNIAPIYSIGYDAWFKAFPLSSARETTQGAGNTLFYVEVFVTNAENPNYTTTIRVVNDAPTATPGGGAKCVCHMSLLHHNQSTFTVNESFVTTNLGQSYVNNTLLNTSVLTQYASRVGVNTSYPAYDMDVYKATGDNAALQLNAAGGTGQARILLRAGSNVTHRQTALDFYNNITSTSTPQWSIVNDFAQLGSNDLSFVENDGVTRAMTVLQNGNVGIGTTTPQYTLDVVGTTRSTGTIMQSYYTTFDNVLGSNCSMASYTQTVQSMDFDISLHGSETSFSLAKTYKISTTWPGAGAYSANTWYRCIPLSQGINNADDFDLFFYNTNNNSITFRVVHTAVSIANPKITLNIVCKYPQNDVPTVANLTSTGKGFDANWTTYTHLPLTQLCQVRTGNVGIGTTNPRNKLDVLGSCAIGTYAGANSAPTNSLIVSGNVGIGTTTPQQLLHVNGNAMLGDGYIYTSGTNMFILNRALIGNEASRFALFQGSLGDTVLNSATGYSLQFKIGNTEHMRLGSDGNVAIGVTTQRNKLDVSGRCAIGTYAGVHTAPANSLIVSGNVGIGITTPIYPLDVASSTGARIVNNCVHYSTNKSVLCRKGGAIDVCKITIGPRQAIVVDMDLCALGSSGYGPYAQSYSMGIAPIYGMGYNTWYRVLPKHSSTLVVETGTLAFDLSAEVSLSGSYGANDNCIVTIRLVNNYHPDNGNSSSDTANCTCSLKITNMYGTTLSVADSTTTYALGTTYVNATILQSAIITTKQKYQAEVGYVGIGTDSPNTRLHVFEKPTQGSDVGITINNGAGGGTYGNSSTSSLYFRPYATSNQVPAFIRATDGQSGGFGGTLQFWVANAAGSDTYNVEQRMIITQSGNVGIGSTNPQFKLDVIGNARVGALSKTSGTFDITHPLNAGASRLVHSFVEGPRCDLIYRGKIQLIGGTGVVNIDKDCVHDPECAMTEGTFEILCANPMYYLQNATSFDRVIGSITGNILTITCENPEASATIYWMVVAERKDDDIKKWDRTNSNGFLVTEYTPE
jgi:hypothetical protein